MDCPLYVTPPLRLLGRALNSLGWTLTMAFPIGVVLIVAGRTVAGACVLLPVGILLLVAAYYIKLQKGGLRSGGWATWGVARLTLWPTIAWNYTRHLAGERKYYDQVRPGVFVGGAPFHWIAAELVHQHGVRAVVNCCEEYAGPEKLYAQMGVEQFRLNCLDFCDVPLEKIIASVEYLCQEVAASATDGKHPPVYIHCKSGKGRAVTIATAYLAKQYHQGNTQSANTEIKQARPTAFGTVYQRPAMVQFAREHLNTHVDVPCNPGKTSPRARTGRSSPTSTGLLERKGSVVA